MTLHNNDEHNDVRIKLIRVISDFNVSQHNLKDYTKIWNIIRMSYQDPTVKTDLYMLKENCHKLMDGR